MTLLVVHDVVRPEQVGPGVCPENKHHIHWEEIQQGPPWEQSTPTSPSLSPRVMRGRSSQQQGSDHLLVLPRCQTPHEQETAFLIFIKECSGCRQNLRTKKQLGYDQSRGSQPHRASGLPGGLI